MELKTVSTKGLSEGEALFLTKLEAKWFEDSDFDRIKFIKENKIDSSKTYYKEEFDLVKYFDSGYKCSDKKSYYTPRSFNDLFNIGEDSDYYLHADIKLKRVEIKKEFKEKLDELTLIYDLDPSNFYFSIIKNTSGVTTLYIKYQYIIGSRALCLLDEDTIPK